MPAYDLYEIIRETVHKELTYYKHYVGKVMSNTDPDRMGRVLVTIPELEWDNNIQIWASPRQGNAMSLPKIDSYVEVYFMNADSGRPVYLHPATEMTNMVPSKFDGNSSTHLIFQDPSLTSNYIKEQSGTFDVKGMKINLLDASEAFILGDTFKTELDKHKKLIQDLQIAFNTWAVVPMDGGGALKTAAATFIADPLPDYTNILSTTIKGS